MVASVTVIARSRHERQVTALLGRHRVVAILGPRQVGKSTLAHRVAAARTAPSAFFDLEDPRDLARMADPMLALEPLRGLVVLDEIQRRPDLFPVLRVLADRRPLRARFLVLGSASPELLRQASESLAGRIAYHELAGFTLEETGVRRSDRLWLRGGFPLSFLAKTDAASAEWRREFVRAYLERDVPQLGIAVPAPTLRRLWTMVAHYHGQLWNASEFGRAFGVADTTVRRYLDALTGTFVVRQLQPWHANVGKRQVKAPKLYVADSGLLHTLLDLDTAIDLERHPKVGASWEGFAMTQVVARLAARPEQCYFWRTHNGAELDLLVVRGRERLGFEFKRTSTPGVTPSMRSALTDLRLTRLDVVHAGHETFPLAPRVRAVALSRLLDTVAPSGQAPSAAHM
jgi:predicted AAA+ superfamily ATPase